MHWKQLQDVRRHKADEYATKLVLNGGEITRRCEWIDLADNSVYCIVATKMDNSPTQDTTRLLRVQFGFEGSNFEDVILAAYITSKIEILPLN